MLNRLLVMGAMVALSTVPVLGQSRGPAATQLSPETDDHHQHSASVIKIAELNRQGDSTVKLYGTAGGDPAMNGLYTYLAFFESTAEGWRVFRVGDFVNFVVLSEAPGQVVLSIRESTMNDATGQIGTRVYRLQLSWTPGPQGAPPRTVRVTPLN